jgi:hypothetical protein
MSKKNAKKTRKTRTLQVDILPESERSTTKIMANELKKKIKRNDREFMRSLKINESKIDSKKLINLFETVSERSRRKILNYTLKSLSIINSIYYVNSNLKDSLGVDEETSINVAEIDQYVKKLFRVKIISIILSEFNLDESMKSQIMSSLIDKQFNPQKTTVNVPPKAGITERYLNEKTQRTSKKEKQEAQRLFTENPFGAV